MANTVRCFDLNLLLPASLNNGGPKGAASSNQQASAQQSARSCTFFDGSELNMFLHSVEIRAVRIAEIATGDRAEALDLVQDAMLSLAEHYATKPPTDWPPLFHRLLQNRIRDWHRHRKVRKTWHWLTGQAADDFHANQPALACEQPQQAAQQEATINALQTALKDLPITQQQTFLLRAWERLSIKETALALSCSEASVKTHYQRATAKLRQHLEKHWP